MIRRRKKLTCATCRGRILPGDNHEIQVQHANGISILKVCNTCADFWDKSADVLQRRSPNDT